MPQRKSATRSSSCDRPTAAATAALALLALLGAGGTPSLAAAQLGYIPPASKGCPQNVKVQIEATSQAGGGAGWFSGGGGTPSVAGRVTVLNGESYGVPVSDVTVMVFPANSPVAPVYADCRGISNGQRVPYSPVPFQYGRASCAFAAPLPTNGPSAGARNWQQARAVVTLTNGAKCYSEMSQIRSGGGGGGWPWGGGGGSWVIGGANPSSSSSSPSWGSGGGDGSRGIGGGMIGSSGPSSSSGLGGSRTVGGANPSSSGGGSGATTTLLGSANPSGGGGGRKMLGVA